MRSLVVGTVAAVLLAFTWNAFLPHTVEGASETAPAIVDVLNPEQPATTTESNRTPAEAVKTGIEWLVSVQGNDGGWAPILGTSLASQSLAVAQKRGLDVDKDVLAKADEYSENLVAEAVGAGVGRRSGGGAYSSRPVDAGSAGVDLYRDAQILEQLSRNENKRRENAPALRKIEAKLSDSSFQAGFGPMGGEEFFSYLNISDSLHRSGGEQWKKWNGDIKTKLARLQNSDGSWAGHHCITGRVAVTGAAVLTLQVDKQTVEEL